MVSCFVSWSECTYIIRDEDKKTMENFSRLFLAEVKESNTQYSCNKLHFIQVNTTLKNDNMRDALLDLKTPSVIIFLGKQTAHKE